LIAAGLCIHNFNEISSGGEKIQSNWKLLNRRMAVSRNPSI